VLESAAVDFNKAFTSWKPEVDASLTSVKLELSKLNSFFDQDARDANTTKPGVLPFGSANQCSSAEVPTDGPNGHHVHNINRDCGFGQVFTQTHDPVKGTVFTSPPPPPPLPKSPSHVEFVPSFDRARFAESSSQGNRFAMGKLPKVNFPKFDGKNPKLWQPHCESYF
jgi:hypothetical protein